MGILDVVSFLSVIPYGRGRLEGAADSIHLFPVVGVVVGAVAGAAGWAATLYMDPLLAGVVVAGVLCVVTGMHHVDGLADTADGLMKHGGHDERIRAMRDKNTGTAGVGAIVLCFMCVVIAVSQRTGSDVFMLVVLAEASAKYGMVVAAYAGRPATGGTGAVFCNSATTRRFAICSFLWVVPAIFMPTVMLYFVVAVATGIVMVVMSRYRFGGITGDVLGATNELARAACLVVSVSV